MLNAYDSIIFVGSKEPSNFLLFSILAFEAWFCIKYYESWKKGFSEISVQRIFTESCDIHLLKKSLHSSPCKNLLMCFSLTEIPCSKDVPLRGAMLNAVDFAVKYICKKSGLNYRRLASYIRLDLAPNARCTLLYVSFLAAG